MIVNTKSFGDIGEKPWVVMKCNWMNNWAPRIPSSSFISWPAEIENITEVKRVPSSEFMITRDWRLIWSQSVFSSNLVRDQLRFGHKVSQARYYLLVSGDWKHSWSRVFLAHGFFLDQPRLKPWLGTKCLKPNIISWSVEIEHTVGHKKFPAQVFFLDQRILKTWLKHKECQAQVLVLNQWRLNT